MKRFLALMLALLTLALSSCAGTSAPSNESAPADALTLLNTVWDKYDKADRFPAAGGDFSDENAVTDAPGAFSVEDPAALDYSLGLPEDMAPLVKGAASLTHMMNANTFTCGAFELSGKGDAAQVTEAISTNLQNRQWMCGFPDKMTICVVDQYVVCVFGQTELVDGFTAKLKDCYPQAETVDDRPLV